MELLPQDVVKTAELDSFKRRLGRFIDEMSITGYKLC